MPESCIASPQQGQLDASLNSMFSTRIGAFGYLSLNCFVVSLRGAGFFGGSFVGTGCADAPASSVDLEDLSELLPKIFFFNLNNIP